MLDKDGTGIFVANGNDRTADQIGDRIAGAAFDQRNQLGALN